MRSIFKGLVVVCGVALLSGSARADTPNFNKRGSTDKEEKEFVEQVAQTIVKEARSSVKDITLQEYKFKEGAKEGRMNLTISAGYKGAVIKTKYSADIVVQLDTSDKDNWKVLKIEYKDNNKSPVSFSSKNVEALVKTFNNAARN
jgi:D-aminopeptidase